MKYIIITRSETKCNQVFTDSYSAIEEAKLLSNSLCCDCQVLDDSGLLVAFINKRYFDSLGKFHDTTVCLYS